MNKAQITSASFRDAGVRNARAMMGHRLLLGRSESHSIATSCHAVGSSLDATTIGIDLAKDVFEIAISAAMGRVSARRRLSRRQFGVFVETLQPGTTVVMEACGTAHYWARRCRARGAEVRLWPAQYVRPYVRRKKTDRADAEALLEAHRCGAMHAVDDK